MVFERIKKLCLKNLILILILCHTTLISANQYHSYHSNHHHKFTRFNKFIEVPTSICYNESCYSNLTDVYNSPLVQCSYLPEQFYECPKLSIINSTANCSKWGQTKYGDVQVTYLQCKVFDNIECRGSRTFNVEVPCIIYTDKYFVSTLLYSIFLGIFAVDRCCLGQTGIGIGKLITIGGIGIWYIIDIILLVLGIIKPNDHSNWIPYF